MDDLKERLRAHEALIVDYADALEKSDDFADTVIGSDLREGSAVIDSAIARIEALEQRVSELEEALRQCRFELDYCQQQLAAHGQTGHPEDSVSRALRAATAALNRKPNP
jgi:chromosome segregation ATPase